MDTLSSLHQLEHVAISSVSRLLSITRWILLTLLKPFVVCILWALRCMTNCARVLQKRRKRTKLKIAIVGGGPAGASLAYLLHSEVDNISIDIYEQSNRIGGQSESIKIGKHLYEMGTIYLTVGYLSVMRLVRLMGLNMLKMQQKNTYLTADNKKYDICPTISTVKFSLYFMFYWVKWKLSKQDTNPTHEYNHVIFNDWLKSKKLIMSDPLVQMATTGQLYGPPSDITVWNAFQWIKPSLFFTAATWDGWIIKEGFQTLWKRLIEESRAHVHLKSTVSVCESNTDGTVRLTYKSKKITHHVKYDHVFITIPLDTVANPLTPLITDKFRSQYILVNLVKVENWPFDTSVVYTFNDKRVQNMSSIGRFPVQETKKSDYPTKSTFITSFYRLGQTYPVQSLASLVTSGINQLKSVGGMGSIGPVAHTNLSRYNVTYSEKQFRDRLPQTIESLQGTGNVWYGGGTLSHWNANSIVNQNVHLLQLFRKQTRDSHWLDSLYTRLLPLFLCAFDW